ncbi:hypothetical protein [Corynebacterium bovis]|uniref:hypothetical protein n=1 Tax=Corynebacterium bovis TaxID=36808 RepID=UPI000F647BB9|nr:hypothetical protein [Corynebacterium bovis]RRQ16032.1 hypothetical protein CXF46_05215 [Corynebacterium bovis]
MTDPTYRHVRDVLFAELSPTRRSTLEQFLVPAVSSMVNLTVGQAARVALDLADRVGIYDLPGWQAVDAAAHMDIRPEVEWRMFGHTPRPGAPFAELTTPPSRPEPVRGRPEPVRYFRRQDVVAPVSRLHPTSPHPTVISIADSMLAWHMRINPNSGTDPVAYAGIHPSFDRRMELMAGNVWKIGAVLTFSDWPGENDVPLHGPAGHAGRRPSDRSRATDTTTPACRVELHGAPLPGAVAGRADDTPVWYVITLRPDLGDATFTEFCTGLAHIFLNHVPRVWTHRARERMDHSAAAAPIEAQAAGAMAAVRLRGTEIAERVHAQAVRLRGTEIAERVHAQAMRHMASLSVPDPMDPGSDLGAEFGGEFGADAEAEFGAEFGADVEADLGADFGADVEAEFGADFGADADADADAHADTEADRDTGAGHTARTPRTAPDDRPRLPLNDFRRALTGPDPLPDDVRWDCVLAAVDAVESLLRGDTLPMRVADW